MFKSAVIAAVALLITAVSAFGQEPPANPLPEVLDARVSTTPQRARLVLDLAAPTQFAIVSLDNPNRIAIDVKASGLEFTELTPVAGEGIVASYNVEMAESGRARTTLTLSAPAQVQQAYVLDPFADQPARLVVDIIPMDPAGFAAKVAADLAASTVKQQADMAADEPTRPGASNIEAKTRPLVVIDPGHGGVDSGARGPDGVMEKDLVLAFALKLQDLLTESGRFDVALTREDDSFLKLEDRVALARQNKADLFISIHADSFQQPDIRGLSVYTRDENATDVLDRVLADTENKADIIAGLAPPESATSVVDLLVDLMRREMRRQSYEAAQSIVHQVEPSVALRKFPVRQANFLVLQAPDVPSILVELGFLSNAHDIANLQQSGWQDRTAEAVARGISAYFDELAQGNEQASAEK
ncbi:N-acetylmuramoyl-L-alanine amidase [Paradevosia shaoguanensis]|uniref:N-acetylmuramoyl-L-alanine amidase n=1 Tax=Paradevosia shaoguanensis TaxID=1335043 RepID=A0AA41UDD9_9HYPH|nr:N-acetylmuramoyl-L-alanine amidase [Paradevosia shaoguanensis]MCF1742731.1 N-acetylmuramoyl-L-alanine amidase [Paradevosia shaoguanensis]MCI0127214.1 N-acetylmuramoyl-L-alanine amidase [Paradevosia shaoguanensis]